MEKLKYTISLIFFIHLALYSHAQYTVMGTLADSTGQSIEGAALVVMDAKDTTSIVWEYAKEKKFSIRYNNPEKKACLLYIQAYGYKSIYRELLPQDQDLGKIILRPFSYNLAEVSVIREVDLKYNFVRGKDEFTIPKAMGEQEFDLNSLLANIPGLAVDGEKVTIIGRGAPVYTINGLKPRPGDMASLSPKDIEKIVIDRMPSAKWDKNVVGIIDIVTRKNIKDYMNLRVKNNFQHHREPQNYSNIAINNKIGRWTNYLGSSYDRSRVYYKTVYAYTLYDNDTAYRRIYSQSPLFRFHKHTLNYSPKFQINDKSFIDLQYLLEKEKTNSTHPEVFEIVGLERDVSDGAIQQDDDKHNLILRYSYENEKGNRLVLNTGYSKQQQQSHSINQERITDTTGVVEIIDTEYSSLFSSDVFSFSANYDFSIGKNLFTEAGLEYAEIWNKSSTDYKDGATYKTNTEETQAAAYFNLGQQIGKLGYQIGIRGEYLYKHHPAHKDANDHPWSFLPSVSLSYDLSKNTNATLYFRRTTTHPTLSERDPILHHVNKYEYLQGNPNLKSYIENELSFRVRLPKKFIVALSYNFAKNPIITMDDIYNIETKQTVLTHHNFPKEKNFTANVSWNGKFNFYGIFLTGTYDQTWAKSPFLDGFANYHKPMLGIRVQQMFRIIKNVNLNITSNYKTSHDGICDRNAESYNVDAGLITAFFKRKLNVTLGCYNIVYSNTRIRSKYKRISTDDRNFMYNRLLRIGIIYNFNNFKDIFRKNDSNADILKRVQ